LGQRDKDYYEMKKSGKCPKCGATDITENARLLDGAPDNVSSSNLRAVNYSKPHALLFRGRREFIFDAWICKKCGYSELYSSEL
jgi:predicted nucleic-acid-binding Zn-ribbon protein